MRNIGFNAEQCRRGLLSYSEEIDELMNLIKDTTSMTSVQIEKARTQLANLKACLKQDCRLRDTNEGLAKMTDVEAAIYAPAVQQAFADLHIKTSSRPSREWFDELYGIQITIKNALVSLEKNT